MRNNCKKKMARTGALREDFPQRTGVDLIGEHTVPSTRLHICTRQAGKWEYVTIEEISAVDASVRKQFTGVE
jgi:hypothetical protein